MYEVFKKMNDCPYNNEDCYEDNLCEDCKSDWVEARYNLYMDTYD